VSSQGIWTIEIYGPFGWDNCGVFILEKGRVTGGDNRQYTTGTYKKSGNEIEAKLMVHYYGPPRTMFGEASEQISTRLSGTIENDVIDGTIRRNDKPKQYLRARLTKRLDLPKA